MKAPTFRLTKITHWDKESGNAHDRDQDKTYLISILQTCHDTERESIADQKGFISIQSSGQIRFQVQAGFVNRQAGRQILADRYRQEIQNR